MLVVEPHFLVENEFIQPLKGFFGVGIAVMPSDCRSTYLTLKRTETSVHKSLSLEIFAA